MKKAITQSLWNYKSPPPVQTAPFKLWSLVVSAWRLSHGQRMRFLVANYIVVILSLIPILAPFFAARYPGFMGAPFLPTVSNEYARILTVVMPWCFFVFFAVPLKLSLFFIAVRIAARQQYHLPLGVFHYLRFFWLVNILSVIVLAGFFVGMPIIYVMSKLVLDVFDGNATALTWVLWFFAAVGFVFAVYVSVWASLLFIGRVNLFIGYKAAIKAVNHHFWKVLVVLLLEAGFMLASEYSWHLSDLLFAPFSYLLWIVLYQQLFGVKACRV